MTRAIYFYSLVAMVGIFLFPHTTYAQNPSYKAGQKKILEFGWDIPEYTYFADNIATMEYAPFDGVVFDLKVLKGTNKRGYSVCNTDLVPESAYDFTKMTKIRSTKFTDNFIRVFVQDDIDQSKFSWYDDAKWVNIKSNTKLLVKAVNACAAKGIFLDTEHYFDPNPWAYNATLYPNQTFEQVYDKVRQRGREYMSELQTGKPDIKVLYAFGYDFADNWGTGGFQFQDYALMKPFLDGMLEAAGPQVTLIDGNEASYWSAKNDIFTWWTKQIKEEYPKDRIPAELVTKYKAQYQAASATVVNRYFNIPYGQAFYNFDFGFTLDFQKKWLKNSLYNHLLTTDEYVWTWSQGDVDWWTKPTFQNKQEWIDGINDAKSKIAAGQPAGTVMKYAGNKIEADFEDAAPFVATLSAPTHGGNVPVGNVTFTLTPNDPAKLNYYYLYVNGYADGYLIDPTKTLSLTAGKYTAWVFGYTKDNKIFQSNHVTFTVGATPVIDTQAPSIPATISASNITSSSFTATWTASSDNVGVVSYDVFRDGVLTQNTQSTNFSFTGLTANTTYNVTVKARDAAGNISAASTALAVKTLAATVADTQAPSTPASVTASNITTSSFTATWTASSDNVGVVSYDVFRDGVLTQNTQSTNFSFTGLTANTTYNITVKARDAAGNISAASTALAVKTLANTGSGDLQAPTPPNYVQPYSITTSGFSLQWSGAADNVAVTGYEVFLNGTSFAKTGQYVTYLSLNNLLQATNYSVTIKAYDAAGNVSAASTAVIVTTLGIADIQAPSIPLNLKATNITANSFTISWAAATDNVGVTKYSIYRNSVLIATVAGNVTTFDVKNLVPSNSYSMAISASDAVNNTSKTSTALIVKTLASMTVTNNLITFSEQGVGTKGLAPAVYNNVDAKNSNATFVGFSSSDGVISKPTFEDKTLIGDNRMATITSANATMSFNAPVIVSSLWTTSIMTTKATGWTLTGSLNGVNKFTFTPNASNFAIKSWLETTIGKGIAIDKLTWLNASGVMIDDIQIQGTPIIAAKISSNSATVSPNPIQDYANITFTNNSPSPTVIRLVDFNGKEYFTKIVETLSGENYFQLDGTALPNGFYLLFISRQERNESLKILIQR
jgi:chitodextrinase